MNQKEKVIFKTPDSKFRIVEVIDEHFDLDDLKGDVYNPEANPEIDPAMLKRQEAQFEMEVERQGVYGYVLERWNPDPDKGWEQVESCWGFVGRYSENGYDGRFNHEIVKELKELIEKGGTYRNSET